MNLRDMPDSEFQNLLVASYKYDWDLAVKLEGLESVSQVPDSVWDEFGEFYCQESFIGTINNYIDEELDYIFGEGAELDITNEISFNSTNKVIFYSEILKPATSVDEDIYHDVIIEFEVDGENLFYKYSEA